MAIADTITSMQNHTSNAYNMLSNGTDLTGINKNLENLSSTIFEAFLEALRNPDTLFNNLPKTSASGSNITLNNTAYAPMRITLNPTAITQDGTPTPSSPQDIHTISGNNSVVVEGKNLISSVAKNGNRLFFNGANETDYQFKSGTYTFSFTKNISGNIGVFLRTASTSSSNIGGTSPITFTSNEDFNIWFYRSGIELTDVSNVQLEKGSVESPVYTPYVSQTNPINLGEYELGTIGNYSNEFVRSGGENLFNPSDLVQGYLSNTLIDNRTTTARTDAILLKAGTYYYKFKYASEIWVKMVTYTNTTDTSGTYVFNSKSSNYTTTFTLTNDTYVRFGFDEPLSNITASATIMLSTKNIDYVPYEKGWYYKQGIGKVVLDGSETGYSVMNGKANSTYFQIQSIESLPTPTGETAIGLCSHFGANTSGLYSSNTEGFTYSINGYFRANILNTILGITSEDTNTQKIDKFKSWVSTNSPILYYPLATPTYTKITGELANQLEQVYKGMLSYDGTTNISQVNNDLAFVINASGITK